MMSDAKQIIDFKRIKTAKESQADVTHALKIVSMAIAGLEQYRKYRVIHKPLIVLHETKEALDTAVKMYDNILNKGKK